MIIFTTLFKDISEKGWKITIIFEKPAEVEGWVKGINTYGGQIVYLPRPRRNFDLATIRRTFLLCRKLRCDVVHCDNIHTSPLIGAALAGVPVRIWSKRSMNHEFEKRQKPGIRDTIAISTRISCLLSTRILAVSDSVRNELIKLKMPSSKILTFNNSLSVYDFSKVNREDTRLRFGYDKNDVIVVTVGHAAPVKGWDILLDAFSEISDSYPCLKVVLVGSTDIPHEQGYFAELIRRVNACRLNQRVKFMGHIPDVTEALVAGDIFVLPSRSEGNSNALIEALCAGLPCIATRVGAADQMIQDGANGFLVEREDPCEMGRSLLALAADKNLRNFMAVKSRPPKWIPTPEEYNKTLMHLYETLSIRAGKLRSFV